MDINAPQFQGVKEVFKCESCGKVCKNSPALKTHLWHENKKNEVLKKQIEAPVVEKKEEPIKDLRDYKRLPPPVVEHLEKSWGNWLNHFEVKMLDWKPDFGGAGIYIKVPPAFSSETQEATVIKYNNKTREKIEEKKVMQEDIRTCPLKDVTEAIKWLDKVKEHIVTNAFRKGLVLPTTGIKYDSPNKSLEDYKRELAGV